MRLGIIVAHTQAAKGSKGVRPLDMHEYDFNKELAIDIWREAKDRGIDCQVFTFDNLTWPLLGNKVNEWCGKSGVCIELHCNTFNGKVTGTETLFDNSPDQSKTFARHIHDHICSALNRKPKENKGIRLVHEVDEVHFEWKSRGFNVRSITVPSCIVQPVFWDNHQESSLLWRERNRYVKSLIVGTLDYFAKTRVE